NSITANDLNTGTPVILKDRNANFSSISLRGFGQTDPSLVAVNASDLAFDNVGDWNDGSAIDWMDPAAAQDFVFGDVEIDYVFAIAGLDPAKSYRIELVSATSSAAAGVAHNVFRTIDGAGSVLEVPDANRTGATGPGGLQWGTDPSAPWDTNAHGWTDENWIIWEAVTPGVDDTTPSAQVLGVDAGDLVIGVSGGANSEWLMNALRISEAASPEITVVGPSGGELTSGISSVDFGENAPGASRSLQFEMRNDGADELTVASAGFSGADAGYFQITQAPASNIPSAGSSTFEITFTPDSVRSFDATFLLGSNDADESTFQIALTATGKSAQTILNETISAAGLAGPNASLLATPYEDGVENLLKYAFNMNLSGPDVSTLVPGGTSGLPIHTVDRTGPETVWRVEFLRRKGSGLIYTPMKSTTLDSFEPMTGEVTTTSVDSDWERVVVEEQCDPSTTPNCFSHVKVTVP
ncbi:MAG: hypothetical protein KDN05_20830, partial [Verrucomicrobiae bacterium]|nr:hypothetical protein [Verrucomicrobiae bacterium]